MPTTSVLFLVLGQVFLVKCFGARTSVFSLGTCVFRAKTSVFC